MKNTEPELELPPFHAVILCGGRSGRMGRDKAWLNFGGETFLQSTCSQLIGSATNIVVVAAAGQRLPDLNEAVQVVTDERPDCGPLAGLLTGLNTLTTLTDAGLPVWLGSCDMPFFNLHVVAHLLNQLDSSDAVVVSDNDHIHPFCAVYSATARTKITALLDAGKRSMRSFVDEIDTKFLDADQLREIDPQLVSLISVNTPEDLERAAQLQARQAASAGTEIDSHSNP